MDDLGYSSLEQVSQLVGINRGNLYRYFTFQNEPSLSLLPILCKVLQATPEEILEALKLDID